MEYHKFCLCVGKIVVSSQKSSHHRFVWALSKYQFLIEPLVRQISGLKDISMLTVHVREPLKHHSEETQPCF